MSYNRLVPNYHFHRHDRIFLDASAYRFVRKEKGKHILQRVINDVVEEHYISKTDKEIHDRIVAGTCRIDPLYFSRTLTSIRFRNDSSDLSDLSRDELNTILWKAEWCHRFNAARHGKKSTLRPTMALADLGRFIEEQKSILDDWYFRTFGERRKPGRKIPGQPQKAFDYPSAGSLRNWILMFAGSGYRLEVFRPRYDLCGNRHQMDPRVLAVVSNCVENYASSAKPTMLDIYEDVELGLIKLNGQRRSEEPKLYVSERTVRRRIKKIDPFIRDLNREGKDRALRKYMGVGVGIRTERLLERVEVDDWEVDLHTLITKSSAWKNMSSAERDLVPRIRCTATIAICTTSKCIVGFSLSPDLPATYSAKTAARSLFVDKTQLAQESGCATNWSMFGRAEMVVSDGGSAFSKEFREALALVGVSWNAPEADPRKRGTIESFFRVFKRVCRYFAGQTFANVVQRGDYPSEEMASVTFEEFHKAVVRFLVDWYHNRPHKGLFKTTPYAMWQRKMPQAGHACPSDRTLRIAFSHRIERNLSKQGVVFMDLQFNSNELNRVFAYHKNVPLDVYVDENDLTSVLVRRPEDRTRRLNHSFDGYIEVPCMEERYHGWSLAQYWERHQVAARVAKDDVAANIVARVEAHDALYKLGEAVRIRANLPAFRQSTVEILRVEKALEMGRQAAMGAPYAGDPPPFGTMPGEVIAEGKVRDPGEEPPTKGTKAGKAKRPKKPEWKSDEEEPPAKPSRPLGGDINFDDEDEVRK